MGSAYFIVIAVAAAMNLIAGIWGAALWLRRSVSIDGNLGTVLFWYLLRAAQAASVIAVLFCLVLYIWGREPDSAIHYLYVVLPLVISLIAEVIRAGAAIHETRGIDVAALPAERQMRMALAILRRETGIMASSSLICAFLLLRALEKL